MKLLTKEEEDAHYTEVVKGGSVGGVAGLAVGAAGVLLASRRFHTIRTLTTPMKAFLVTSTGTFGGIIAADHASRAFELERNAVGKWYENREERLRAEENAGLSLSDRITAFARREKYKIVSATWIASMLGSFALVGRNPYLSGQQKLVQARVYAQGLTLGVLCASAAFEISDQRRGRGLLDAKKAASKAENAAEPAPVRKDRESEGDLWKDMVAAEEQRLTKKHQSLYEHHAEQQQAADAEKSDDEKTEESNSEDEKKDSKSEKKDAKSDNKKNA
ncbi:unnamed protein product [Penicillium bialowiezense]